LFHGHPHQVRIQLVAVRGAQPRFVQGDPAGLDEAGQRFFHRDHTLAAPDRELGMELVVLSHPDEVADGVVGDEDLAGWDAAVTVRARDEGLHGDPRERERDLLPDLVLLSLGKDVDQPVDRL
jgi:hypothetical protein